MALTLNSETEDFRLMQEETGRGAEAMHEYHPGETVKKILQKPAAPPPLPKPEQRPPPQAAGPPANIAFHRDDTMEQILKGMEEMRLNQMRLSEKVGYLYSQRVTGFEEMDYPVGPPRRTITQAQSVTAHPRACRWCGNLDLIKVRRPDYKNCLAQEIVQYPNQNDTRTRLERQGSLTPVVSFPEISGLWQQNCVDRQRGKPESQMQRNRIEGVPDHPTPPSPATDSGSGKVRALTFKEIPHEHVSPGLGVLLVGSRGLDLVPDEIRSFVAQESVEGELDGWVEAKRTADQMENTPTLRLGAYHVIRKRQARAVSYPSVGGGAAGPAWPRVSFAEGDDEVIMQAPPASAEQLELEEVEEEEILPVKKPTPRAWRKTGTQHARCIPIKLRTEAQPEKIVDKIRDHPIKRITMREL